jgi:hypothetical protein
MSLKRRSMKVLRFEAIVQESRNGMHVITVNKSRRRALALRFGVVVNARPLLAFVVKAASVS